MGLLTQTLTQLLLCVMAVNGQIPTVSVLPEVLWGTGGDVTRNIVETAVIQLYCSGSGATIEEITWSKDGTTLTNDPPHLRIRGSSTDVSILTIDNFNSSDDGQYVCHVTGSTGSNTSPILTLTALGSAPSTLTFVRQPSDLEGDQQNTATSDDALTDNRTAIFVTITEVDPSGTANGDLLLRCICGHEDTGLGITAPSVVWVRDGVQLMHDGTKISINTVLATNTDRRISDLQILNLDDSDGGVIQCIWTDTDSDAEVFPSIPHRLDRGQQNLFLGRVTPPGLVIIDPPEKLVLEVESSGGFARLGWARNNVGFSFAADAEFPATTDRFINFYEIYVRDPTDTSHLGEYEVEVVAANFAQNQPADVVFIVVPYVEPTTTAGEGMSTLTEGDTVAISCTSTGIPTPSIVWRFRGAPTRLTATDDTPTNPDGSLNPSNDFIYTEGSVTSTLQIVAPIYPDDDGVYECFGINSHGGVDTNTSDTITVVVQAIPVVDIVADPRARIALGQSVTLTCNVTKANPTAFTYEWTFEDTGTTLSETSETLTLSNIMASQFGNYTCDVTNDAGTGSDTITIDGEISLQQPSPVEESVGSVEICAGVFGGDLDSELTVNLTFTDGTATMPDDYSPTSNPVTLVFPNGTMSGGTSCTSVTIVNDNVLDCNHDFTVEITSINSSSPNVTVGTPSSVTVTIQDTDDVSSVMVAFEQTTYTASEGNGTTEVCVEVSGVPGGGLECEIVVTLTTMDGDKAVVGNDFTVADPLMVTFPTTSVSGDTACAAITILDDDAFEGDHSFTVQLTSTTPTGVTIGTDSSTTVTIQDNDVSSVMVAFEQTTYTASEGNGTTEVCVEVSGVPGGGLECEIVVTLTTMDGDKAVFNEDFIVADPLMVTFPTTSVSGDTACAAITILDDDAFEGDHSFTVNLTSTTPTGVTIGTVSSTTVTIQDNDVSSVTVAFEQTTYTASEGNGTTQVCVEVSGIPASGLECEIMVTLTTMDGDKAVVGNDFTVADPLMVTFPTTSVSGDTACADITILDDDVLEGDHSFRVNLTSTTPTGVTIGTDSSTTVTIQDNDVSLVTVAFEQTTYTVSEGDGSTQVCVEVSGVPAGGLESEIVVTLSPSDDTAVRSTDFTVADPFTVTFPTASVSGGTVCADITILDDDVVGGDISFSIHLISSTPSGVTFSGQTYTTVTIQNDDRIQIPQMAYSAKVIPGGGAEGYCSSEQIQTDREEILADVQALVDYYLGHPQETAEGSD